MRKHILVAALALVALMIPASARAGDAFVKLGFLLNDLGEDLDIGDRWQIGAGSDWKVADTVGIGFEIQFAYRKFDETAGDPPVTTEFRKIPLNFFGNVKFKPEIEGGVHPLVGAGFGMMGSINSAKVGDADRDIDNRFDAGFHAMGGVELGSKDSAAFLLEFELSRPLVDGAQNGYFLYAGIRF